MSSIQLLDLPTGLLLLILEHFSAADLAAFAQTAKAPRGISLPILESVPLEQVLDEFETAAAADSHNEMLALAPILKRAGNTSPKSYCAALTSACKTSCGEVVSFIIGPSFSEYYAALQRLTSGIRLVDLPLFVALQNQHSTAPLRALVRVGATLKDIGDYCMINGPYADYDFILPHTDEFCLHRAVIGGMIGGIKFLLSNGYDPNWTVTHLPSSPLVLAAKHDNSHVVPLLVEGGADVNRDADGWGTALGWAAKAGHEETARVLIEHGADINAVDSKGYNALSWAARNEHVHMIQMLLDHGANAQDSDDNQFCRPLEISFWKRHWDAVRVLIRHRVLVNGERLRDVCARQLETEDGRERLRRVRNLGIDDIDLSDLGNLGNFGTGLISGLSRGVRWLGLC